MLPDLRFFVGAALVAALVGMAGLGLFAVAQSRSNMGPLEASRSRAFADHAEWNQFYDADSVRRFVGLGRKAEIAQPADPAPEIRGESSSPAPVAPAILPPEISDSGERQDAASVPAPSPAVAPSAVAALPAAEPPSAVAISAPEQPHEPANAAAIPPAIAALPDHPDDRRTDAAIPHEPTRDQEPRDQEPWDTTPSVTASDPTAAAGADRDARALIPPSNATGGGPMPNTLHSTAPPPATARARATAPMPPVRIGAPVRRSDPEPEPPPYQSFNSPSGWR